ncbi:MAG TPA: nucleotidyltransferase family protein [Solirubrobacterales bacterium]|nr:nucleotidyltransferase family protein [Solirubrobacterales bacterium]
MIAGIVLAAGGGRRFGGHKQLAELDGRPLLEHALRAMAAAPLDRVFVVLGADAAEVQRQVDPHGAEPVFCDGWEDGMSTSLRTGVDAADAAGADAVVIALGDQPRLSPRAVGRLIDARGEAAALRASYGGIAGHPVLLERKLFSLVRELHGDDGARAVLVAYRARKVACDDLGSPFDVDTPADLARLRPFLFRVRTAGRRLSILRR